MPQVPSSTAIHDVVVVGSGAGGGTVTNVLANLGVSVLDAVVEPRYED